MQKIFKAVYVVWYDMVLISWNETVNLYGFSVSWSPIQLELVLPLLLLFQSKTKVLPLLFAAETLTKLNNDTIDNQDYHESLHQKKRLPWIMMDERMVITNDDSFASFFSSSFAS